MAHVDRILPPRNTVRPGNVEPRARDPTIGRRARAQKSSTRSAASRRAALPVSTASRSSSAAADGALPTKPNRLLVSSATPSGLRGEDRGHCSCACTALRDPR